MTKSEKEKYLEKYEQDKQRVVDCPIFLDNAEFIKKFPSLLDKKYLEKLDNIRSEILKDIEEYYITYFYNNEDSHPDFKLETEDFYNFCKDKASTFKPDGIFLEYNIDGNLIFSIVKYETQDEYLERIQNELDEKNKKKKEKEDRKKKQIEKAQKLLKSEGLL